MRNNRKHHSRHFLMYPSNKKEVEAQKVIAEKLNGRLAMLGIIAGIGAYLTTGQLIPGFV
ncbi:MAG: high light inducible protein [Pseudomonadota bacterium]|nr:high light inducible protein [Pseudomonadota bacterium]